MSTVEAAPAAAPAPQDLTPKPLDAPVTTPDAKKKDGAKADEDDDKLITDDGSNDIHAKLRALRLDEVVGLSQSSTNQHTVNTVDNYKSLILLETGRYLRYIWQTWSNVFFSTIFGGLGIFDWFSIMFFAVGGTVFLAVVLVFCLSLHFPALVRIYYLWADKYGGGLGLVNSGNPNLFNALTQPQAAAAKAALSGDIKKQSDTQRERFFNLDIAKLTLQIASVIYEHENDSIRTAVTLAANKTPSSFAPTLSAAFQGLSESNLNPIQHLPGTLVKDVFGAATGQAAAKALDSAGDQRIRDFCKKFGIDFEPISELNNTASAFAGLFWDPKSNWIIISFKGTAPIEFGEWLSDFNASMTPCGSYIAGFERVHKGFKERVFPEDVSSLGNFRPYDTIRLGVRTLAKWLRKQNNFPDSTKINVWFTGHSLGCATASLVYSRFLMSEKEDLGKKINLRNAYLFAAPILCDRASVGIFNRKMNEDPKKLKTMWRITSNGDVVATCLPELGDYTNFSVSPNNAFAFAHLGTELKMRDRPYTSHVLGNHISYGTPVHIESAFTKEEIEKQRAEHLAQPGEQRRETIGILLQKVPLIGRVIAHCTIFYWDQLDRVATGKCDWISW